MKIWAVIGLLLIGCASTGPKETKVIISVPCITADQLRVMSNAELNALDDYDMTLTIFRERTELKAMLEACVQ